MEHADQVRELLHRAGRGRIARETIDQLLEAAKESIGTRQAEDVTESQLCSIFDYLETVRQQITDIEKQLDQRRGARFAIVLPGTHRPIGCGRSTPKPAQSAISSGPNSTSPTPASIQACTTRATRSSGAAESAIAALRCCVTPCTWPRSSFCRRHDYFRRIYRKHLSRGKKHRNALVIVARRLARVIWRHLTDGREFTARPPRTACSFVKPRKSASTKKAICVHA